MLTRLRQYLADRLWLHSVSKHRSRLGFRDAPRYTKYLQHAQRSAPIAAAADPEIAAAAANFTREGWATFWRSENGELARAILRRMRDEEAQGLTTWQPNGRYALGEIYTKFPEVESLFRGSLGDFLLAAFGTHFKIYYGVAYRSRHDPEGAKDSALWHADGGPGTCINVMFCLSPVSGENGAMECLPWQDSLELFRTERPVVRARLAEALRADPGLDRLARRKILTDYYRDRIAAEFSHRIVQPISDSGLIFAFRNNLVHKGGFPQPGHERQVCVFHVYPSDKPTPFERYRKEGIPKIGPYPADPAEGS